MGLFDNINFNKLKEGLTKTRNKLVNSISETVSGKAVIDVATLDEIEEILITSYIWFDTSEKIIENARKKSPVISLNLVLTMKEQQRTIKVKKKR